MKKNILSFTLLALFLMILPINGAFAQEDSVDTKYAGEVEAVEEASSLNYTSAVKPKPANATDIKAATNTSKTLEEAYTYINEKGEEVQVTKLKVSQADRGKSYDITIDPETNEYVVKESEDLLVSPPAQTLNTNYFMGATYTTLDPVAVALNRSRHELTWGGSSTDAWKVSRNATAWAANPSSLGTHWYVGTNKYEGHVDEGKYINSSSYHSYWNTDFGSDSTRTDVWHRVNIQGYNTGYAYVVTERGKSGEGSSLLSFKLATY